MGNRLARTSFQRLVPLPGMTHADDGDRNDLRARTLIGDAEARSWARAVGAPAGSRVRSNSAEIPFVSKLTKQLKKQAIKAEMAAKSAPDDFAAGQLKALATAFRTQAKVIKKNKKKKPQSG